MNIASFKLEQYFAKHEFTARYMLSSSDCDGFPMEYVLQQASTEELSMWNNLKLGYTEGLGSLFLREAICRFYTKATPENVIVASPGELSFILMNVFMQNLDGNTSKSEKREFIPEDATVKRRHAVVISPAYQSLYEVLKSLNCDISYWKPRECCSTYNGKNNGNCCGGQYYDIEDLRKLVRKDTGLIIINFPHNPTGAYLTRKQLDEIVEIAKLNGAYIYSDEMYRELIIKDGVEALPSVSDIYEKGISLWGTAKSFGLAGLRTGWLVSQDKELLSKVHSFKDYLSICSSAPSEVLTAIALNHSEKFIEPNILKIKENVAFFKKAVEEGKLPFVSKFEEPVAGSVAFVKIEPEKAEYLLGHQPKTALEFSDAIVEKYGIMTIPASMFECDCNKLRIGFGRENFKEVLSKLFV